MSKTPYNIYYNCVINGVATENKCNGCEKYIYSHVMSLLHSFMKRSEHPLECHCYFHGTFPCYNFHDESIPIKMHMLEDNVIDQTRTLDLG